jgi:hypothetical protein
MASIRTSWKQPANLIVNGNFDIWQRAASFTSMSNNTYMADRFRYLSQNTTGVLSATRNTTPPPTPYNLSNYVLQVDVDTADAALDSNTYAVINHNVEGFIANMAFEKRLTLSFLVKAWRAGTYCVCFSNSASDKYWVEDYTINASNVWQRVHVNVTLDQSGASWDWKDGLGLAIYWPLAAGSSYEAFTTGQWIAGSINLRSANMVNSGNAIASTSDQFSLAQVQLEIGEGPSTFKFYNIADELLRCQRYYCKSYNLDVNPGTSTTVGAMESLVGGPSYAPTNINFPSKMRSTPSMTLYDSAGNSGAVSTQTLGNNQAATAGYIGQHGFGFINKGGGTNWTAGDWLDFHYVASADF